MMFTAQLISSRQPETEWKLKEEIAGDNNNESNA